MRGTLVALAVAGLGLVAAVPARASLGDGYVPTEGSVILDGVGVPAGQVTSARFSPVLDRVIGMAWVPSPLARDGSQITISDEGRTTEAQIQTKPFYDPDGEVLRS